MKPRLISISGAVHSGKTTVSRMIAAQMPNAFYLDGDMVSSWVGASQPTTATIDGMLPDIHERIIEMIKASLSSELDIIVDFYFDDAVRNQIVGALHDVKFDAKWFLLKPDKQKVLSGSATRPELNSWEVDRIEYHYTGLRMETKLAQVIDSTRQTPVETVKEIMEKL